MTRKILLGNSQSLNHSSWACKYQIGSLRDVRLSGDQCLKLEVWATDLPVDEDAEGMGQEFSSNPMGQVPNISRPDFLEMKLRGQLADGGFHKAAEDARELPDGPRRVRVGHASPQGGCKWIPTLASSA